MMQDVSIQKKPLSLHEGHTSKHRANLGGLDRHTDPTVSEEKVLTYIWRRRVSGGWQP